MRALLIALLLGSIAAPVRAAGHGPVFAGATPTLGRHGWSLDQAWMARYGDGAHTSDEMLRTMLGFGVTERVQLSVSLPIPVSTGRLQTARMTSSMSSTREVETIGAWRFQKRDVGIGARQESTLFVGGSVPLSHEVNSVALGPSLYVSAATGYASRAQYVWVGAGLQQYAPRDGDRVGASRFASVVYGYRPPFLQLEYPKPDFRFFAEATFENRTADTRNGVPASSPASSVFVGPTWLLLYKQYGASGGVLFPVFQSETATAPSEKLRVVVNFSYFFWLR
jgi:hypothetical protein